MSNLPSPKRLKAAPLELGIEKPIILFHLYERIKHIALNRETHRREVAANERP
jgi:hypothetical protein